MCVDYATAGCGPLLRRAALCGVCAKKLRRLLRASALVPRGHSCPSSPVAHHTSGKTIVQTMTTPVAQTEVSTTALKVRGLFRILNFFDIAEAIDLDSLRRLLGPEAAPRSPGFVHLTPEYAQAQTPPLLEAVDPVNLASGERLQARIKYYWFGVASVEFTTEFQCEFASRCAQSYRWMNAPEVEQAAEDVLRQHLERFRPALIKPSTKWLDEDYLVIDIQSAHHEDGRAASATEMLQQHSDQITELVRGEMAPLSATEREEILRGSLSYYP